MSFIIRETTSGNVSRPAKVSVSKEKQDIPLNVRELDEAAVAPGRVNKKRSNTDELLSLAKDFFTPTNKAVIDVNINSLNSNFPLQPQDDIDIGLEAIGRRMKHTLTAEDVDELIHQLNMLAHRFIGQNQHKKLKTSPSTAVGVAPPPPPPPTPAAPEAYAPSPNVSTEYEIKRCGTKSYFEPRSITPSFLDFLYTQNKAEEAYMFGHLGGLSDMNAVLPPGDESEEREREREVPFDKC